MEKCGKQNWETKIAMIFGEIRMIVQFFDVLIFNYLFYLRNDATIGTEGFS